MVSFYFVLSFILIAIIFLRIGLFFSKTKLTINNINLCETNFKIDAQISLYIFYKFKILTIKCNEKGLKIGRMFISYDKIARKVNPEEFVKKTFKPISFNKIKKLNILLEKMYIECKIGTEDMFITVGIVTLISVLLSIFLGNELSKKENKKDLNDITPKILRISNRKDKIDRYKYRVMPEFGKNIFIFRGDLSISFKTRRIGIFLNPKEHTKFKILVGG